MYTSSDPPTSSYAESTKYVADILSSMANGGVETPSSYVPNFLVGSGTGLTPTLTPTTLATIEQSFMDLQSNNPQNGGRDPVTQSGFVPPVVDPGHSADQSQDSYDYSSDESGDWEPRSKKGRMSGDLKDVNLIHTPHGTINATPQRKYTRRNKDEKLPPEEEARRHMRRERNKVAAAKCRQRRVDHTNVLVEETEELEDVQRKLEHEITALQQEREQLEFILQAHQPMCKVDVSRSSAATAPPPPPPKVKVEHERSSPAPAREFQRTSPAPAYHQQQHRGVSPAPLQQQREPPASFQRTSPAPYQQHRESPAPYQRTSPAPYQQRASPVPFQRTSPAPYQQRESPAPYQQRESPAPYQQRESPAPYQQRESPAPYQRTSPAPQQSQPMNGSYPSMRERDHCPAPENLSISASSNPAGSMVHRAGLSGSPVPSSNGAPPVAAFRPSNFAAVATSRPSSLPLIKRDRSRMLSMAAATGISINTPTSGVAITPSSLFCPGLDSMVGGSTGLTPLTGHSCSVQVQRDTTERSTAEAADSPNLISL